MWARAERWLGQDFGLPGHCDNDRSGKNAFSRKPTAIIGTSPGKIGTAVAQQHLRSILAFCNAPLMNSPEAYIQFTDGLILSPPLEMH